MLVSSEAFNITANLLEMYVAKFSDQGSNNRTPEEALFTDYVQDCAICVHVCVCVRLYVCVNVHVRVHICVNVHVRVHICVHVCMCVCVCGLN